MKSMTEKNKEKISSLELKVVKMFLYFLLLIILLFYQSFISDNSTEGLLKQINIPSFNMPI